MGIFLKKKTLEHLCIVTPLSEEPLISSSKGSFYELLFPVRIRLSDFFVHISDYTFQSDFFSKKVQAKGFSQEERRYLRDEFSFHGYGFFERWALFSYIDAKVRKEISLGVVLSWTDRYVHQELELERFVIPERGKLFFLSQYRKSS